MADGSRKRIADVQVGDRVRTTDPATGKAVVRAVTALHRNHDTDLADLVVRDGNGHESILRTTQHHRFWDDTSHGWVEATALATGDRLHTPEGGLATVESVKAVGGQRWMYDLTVDDVHTYYVVAGADSVLVHNCGGLGPDWVPRTDITDSFGCDQCAAEIQQKLGGGELVRVTNDVGGKSALGSYLGQDTGWSYHTAVLHGGRVFDASLPADGVPYGQWTQMWGQNNGTLSFTVQG